MQCAHKGFVDMKEATKLIKLATTGMYGLDANHLAKKCNSADAKVLFGVSGEVEFSFDDGSAIMFDGVHVVEYCGDREVWRDSKPENYYNYNLPYGDEL
jgi:hypothetical protein